MMWLSPKTQQAADFVRTYLLTHSATGNTVDGGSRTLGQSGLRKVFATAEELFAEVALDEDRQDEARGFCVHPALSDATLHAALIAALRIQPPGTG